MLTLGFACLEMWLAYLSDEETGYGAEAAWRLAVDSVRDYLCALQLSH